MLASATGRSTPCRQAGADRESEQDQPKVTQERRPFMVFDRQTGACN
ncbi:hypothetical protein [Massilia eburnea]